MLTKFEASIPGHATERFMASTQDLEENELMLIDLSSASE